MKKLDTTETRKMPDEKNPDQLVADSMSKLFGGLGAAVANPLAVAAGAKPLSGRFRIEGRVTRENGEPVANISIGMMGTETTTDQEGKFELVIEKK
jgi:hypothetical protein